MVTTSASYLAITRDMKRSLERVSKQAEVARAGSYYLKAIGGIKTIDEFLGNAKIFTYAMKAFGLDDMIYAKAFVRKALTDGIDSPKSFANQLADPRFREFVQTFNFKDRGRSTTSFDAAQQGVVDRYLQNQLEQQAGASNEGVRLALYFKRKAGSITSAYSILADQALLKVAQVALSLPPLSGSASIDKQAELIKSKLDISKLGDSKAVDALLNRFTSLWEISNPSTAQTDSSALFSGGAASLTSPSLLLSLQAMKSRSF